MGMEGDGAPCSILRTLLVCAHSNYSRPTQRRYSALSNLRQPSRAQSYTVHSNIFQAQRAFVRTAVCSNQNPPCRRGCAADADPLQVDCMAAPCYYGAMVLYRARELPRRSGFLGG